MVSSGDDYKGRAKTFDEEDEHKKGIAFYSTPLALGILSFFVVAVISSRGFSSNVEQRPLLGKSERLNDDLSLKLLDKKDKKFDTSSPHIIFVLIDDQGHNDMGYTATDALSECTPFIDSLAADGVKLTNYYAQSVCTPSRASLLTGKYPVSLGMQHSHVKGTQPWGLPLDEKILPEFLGEYTNVIIGKWHLGHYSHAHTPLERGFDHFYGFYSGAADYYSHIADVRWCTMYDQCYFDLRDDDAIVDDKQNIHSSYLFDSEMRKAINEHKRSKPLFLYYSLQMVHSPFEVPQEVQDANKHILDKIPSDDRKAFAGLSIMMDITIKNMVDSLKQKGMYENSIIVVASDNGANPAGGNNHPYRGIKGFLYEGAHKVNAFVHSPLLPTEVRGTEYAGLFHVSDWLPTLFSMVGKQALLEGRELDGVDQWEALLNLAGAGGAGALDVVGGNGKEALLYPRTELLYNVDDIGPHGGPLGYTKGALRSGDWKLLVNEVEDGWYPPPLTAAGYEVGPESFDYNNLKTYLFNLREDPYETDDRKAQEPEVYRELVKRFHRYAKRAQPAVFCGANDDRAYAYFAAHGGFVGPWVGEPGGADGGSGGEGEEAYCTFMMEQQQLQNLAKRVIKDVN